MFHMSQNLKVVLAVQPVDLRKSFHGLYAVAVLRDEIRNSGYIQADETPVDFLDPGSGRCGRGYLWTYRASGSGVLFEWFPSRAADCLKGMLAGLKGHLQSDGYAAYLAYFAKLAQGAGPAERQERSLPVLGLNPQEYLRDVLPRLPTMTNQIAHLYTPAKWLAARPPVKTEKKQQNR